MSTPSNSASRGRWLFKSEPDEYSIADLERDRCTRWDGVRNYQARNLIRDQLHPGDLGLFHHSSARTVGPAGVLRVVSAPLPDPTQFDRTSRYHDPRALRETPRWWTVEVEFVERFATVVPLAQLRADPRLVDMMVVRPGARLSIQPVSREQFAVILELAGSRLQRELARSAE
jgi:predicted RNA-binding protein with PUA-like domain